MPHKVEAWKCDYCNKVTISAGSTAFHESHCKLNPSNKYCITCDKCYIKDVVEDSGGTIPYTHKVMWCRQYDKPIYEKPYFEECETEDHYGCQSRDIPGTCAEYERKKETKSANE